MKNFFTIRTEKIALQLKNKGVRICHLSDLHFWFNSKKSNQISKAVIESKPDVVVFTGDYYDTRKGKQIFEKMIQELRQHFPIVLIAGNHDRAFGLSTLIQLGKLENVYFLYQTSVKINCANGICLNFYSKQEEQLEKKEGEIQILLFHNPEKIKNKRLSSFDLILCGHLHGGQFVFWKLISTRLYPASFLYKNCFERNRIKESEVIVSKGLGDSFPFRINCLKEIVMICLE